MKAFVIAALLGMCLMLQYQINHMKDQIKYLDIQIIELQIWKDDQDNAMKPLEQPAHEEIEA